MPPSGHGITSQHNMCAKIKTAFRENLLIAILTGILYANWAFQLYQRLKGPYSKESWQITEWLINYRGGFVRRGLPGEFLLWLYNHFSVAPYTAIIFLSAFFYFAVALFFISLFIRRRYPLLILPLVFFLGDPVLNNFVVRKDLLLITFFILIVYVFLKKRLYTILLGNGLLILALLCHEIIGFFSFPFLFLMLAEFGACDGSRIKPAGTSLLKLSPSLSVFFIVLLHRGSATVAGSVWQSWSDIPFPNQAAYTNTDPSAIGSLSFSLKNSIDYLTQTLTDFYNGVYAPLLWVLVIAAIYMVLTNLNKIGFHTTSNSKKHSFHILNLSATLLFQLVAVIPLFLLGCDFGRWIFYWVSSSFAIYLLVPEQQLSKTYPSFLFKTALFINNIFHSKLPKSPGFIYGLMLLIGFSGLTSGPTWQIKLADFYNTSGIMCVFDFVSLLARKLLLHQ